MDWEIWDVNLLLETVYLVILIKEDVGDSQKYKEEEVQQGLEGGLVPNLCMSNMTPRGDLWEIQDHEFFILFFRMNKPVITIQCGNYANYVGAHFWNLQESGFVYGSGEGGGGEREILEVDNDVLYREGLTLKKEVTYTPRLILMDLKVV